MIGGNGSYVEHQGQVIMHQLITKDQCCHIVDWLKSNSGLFASENFEEKGNPVIKEYCKRKGKKSC